MYINKEQVLTLLHVGRAVEQWIGTYHEHDYTAIKWLRIKKAKENAYTLVYCDVFDDGDEDFFDITDFSAVDADFPEGKLFTFETAEKAIEFAQEQFGCKLDKFVGSGLIQEEYDRYRKSIGL